MFDWEKVKIIRVARGLISAPVSKLIFFSKNLQNKQLHTVEIDKIVKYYTRNKQTFCSRVLRVKTFLMVLLSRHTHTHCCGLLVISLIRAHSV